MTSKDDDTLPLPGFSEELSVDVTADEDFIPTSQPQSSGSSKCFKNSESTEESKSANAVSNSRIKDILPSEAVIGQSIADRGKPADFIPDTERKLGEFTLQSEEISCKKKLSILGPNNFMGALSISSWDADVSKILESPAVETPNFYSLNDSLIKSLPFYQESVKMCEDSITEIIVNDSSETVDLETTPLKAVTSKTEIDVENFAVSGSSGSFGDKETQIFDNSVLLLDRLDPSGSHKNERSSGITSEKLYLQDAIENNDRNMKKASGSCLSPITSAELSEKLNVKEEIVQVPKVNGKASSVQETQGNIASAESETSRSLTRKIEMNLSATCLVSFNPKTNKVLHKIILSVNETPRPKPKLKSKPAYVDHISDSTSEKSKRQSTSSSGSVYSDKTGLPFLLPVRVSTISDQTDSSEDEFALLREKERRALERVLWSNEYLLALKMDDILQASLENNELLKRPNLISPKNSPQRSGDGGEKCSEEVSEVPLSEQTSAYSQGSGGSQAANKSDEVLGEKKAKSTEKVEEKVVVAPNNQSCIVGSESDELKNKVVVTNQNKEPETDEDTKLAEENKRYEKENDSIKFCDGLPVFARWTDKRYYSGVLCGDVKSERWEVKFDDGTVKSVREDFIMPTQWLKVGALVFALNDDQYIPGQIVDIERREEVSYVVELDTEKKKISVRSSDLCLTDVMAGIIRETCKPPGGTPRLKADIDFDNVVSGKRVREQRTPSRHPAIVHPKSSGAKRKSSRSSSSKNKRNVLGSIKETPTKTESKIPGLKSDNGHLVEDKVVSLSENEEGKTPLCGSVRELKKKVKPRSLSYETEEARSKKKPNNWMTPEGSPIPGPSGVKFKKQKTKTPKTLVPERFVVTRSCKKSPVFNRKPDLMEKSKRKRKLEEFVEDVQKKAKGKRKARSKKA